MLQLHFSLSLSRKKRGQRAVASNKVPTKEEEGKRKKGDEILKAKKGKYNPNSSESVSESELCVPTDNSGILLPSNGLLQVLLLFT